MTGLFLFWHSPPPAAPELGVGSSTQSKRRSTVKGRMTRPYSWALRSPRSRSATVQIRAERLGCWDMGRLRCGLTLLWWNLGKYSAERGLAHHKGTVA